MDQNQTTDNQQSSVDNDLQKAIDNITNTTNVDPVFSDPVAAPSSIPEGDTGELDAPIGPFPEANVATVAPAPEPIAPLESMNIPEINNFEPGFTPTPTPESTPEPTPKPIPAPTPAPEPTPTPEPEPAPKSESLAHNLSTSDIKQAALRDLVPLLDKIHMSSSQKFKVYRDIFNDSKDYTVLEPAYQAAREIPGDAERAEALLYLIESIDKM